MNFSGLYIKGGRDHLIHKCLDPDIVGAMARFGSLASGAEPPWTQEQPVAPQAIPLPHFVWAKFKQAHYQGVTLMATKVISSAQPFFPASARRADGSSEKCRLPALPKIR